MIFGSLDLRIPPCITVTNKQILNDRRLLMCRGCYLRVCVSLRGRQSEPNCVLGRGVPSESSRRAEPQPQYFAVI